MGQAPEAGAGEPALRERCEDGVDEVIAKGGQARGLAMRRLRAHQLRGHPEADQRGQILRPRAVAAFLSTPRICGEILRPGRTQSAPAPGGP